MKKIIRVIETMSDIMSGHFAGWLIVGMTALMMAEVVSRYGLRQSLMVSDEFSAYMMLVVSFMALAYAWRRHSHIRIEIITQRLPLRIRNWVRLVALVIALIIVPALTKACYDLITYSIAHSEKSASWLMVPLAPVQVFMFIGCALLCLQIIVELVYAVRTIRTPGGEVL